MTGNLIDLANDILKNADIVEVISHYIKVEKKGRNYAALCPFHNDQELGNFYISKEKGIFKCFACNTGGNAINFVQKIEHISYREAVLKTAEIIGYKDTRLYDFQASTHVDPETKALQDCLKDINEFYQNSLFMSEDGKDALKYLHDRGLSDEIIKTFKIGYAQSKGENIIEYLKSKQYSIKTIADTGIINLNITPYKDVNAGRVTFAITDKNNQVVGFSCRKFKDDDSKTAKYINTASTKLFNKGNLLYNFYNAFNEAKKVGYVYLLEGFMDVIACYRVGIKASIGLMGTALSKDNLQSLRYFGCEIRLCLDLDSPGQLNMQKISDLFDESGIQYKMVNNNVNFSEKDTDEILKNHGDLGLKEYLANLLSKGEWLFNYYQKKLDLNTLDGKKRFILNLLPFLVGIDNDLDQDYYVNKIASLTGYSSEVIFSTIRKYKAKHDKKDVNDEILLKKPNKSEAQIVLSRLQLAEKQILRYMLDNRDMVSQYDLKLGYFSTPIYREIANVIQDYIYTLHDKENYDVKGLMSYLTSELCTSQNKDKILSQISDMVIEEEKIPPCSESQFADLVDTVNKERVKNQTYDVYNASSQNRSELEKAELAKSCLLKVKSIIQEDDKKRRN